MGVITFEGDRKKCSSGIMNFTAYLLLIVSLVATFLIHECSSLKRVEILMPAFVRRGGEVRLTCKYDMDVGSLYAVKWYKGSQEFYRYVPKEVPPAQVFPQPGVRVIISKSDERNVVLRDVPLEISGPFKCVVSAETTFETFSDTNNLAVVVIGDDRPSVELDRAQYHPGDYVLAHCHTPASFPPANVTWYLDDSRLSDRLTKTDIQPGGENVDPMAKVTVSSISFPLPRHVPQGLFQLKCRATVLTAYDRTVSIPVQTVPRQMSDPHTLLRSGSPGTHPPDFYYFLPRIIKVTCAQSLLLLAVHLHYHYHSLR